MSMCDQRLWSSKSDMLWKMLGNWHTGGHEERRETDDVATREEIRIHNKGAEKKRLVDGKHI